MLIDLIETLRQAGVHAVLQPESGITDRDEMALVLDVDGAKHHFAVVTRLHAPYKNELSRLRHLHDSLEHRGSPLLVAPSIGPTLASALTDLGWSWADAAGNYDLRAPGLRLRQVGNEPKPVPVKREIPRGSGSTALVRWLISGATLGDLLDVQELRRVAGISQPRVSQILRRLYDANLVARVGRKYIVEDIEPLLTSFLRDYPGAGGSEYPLYSLEHPTEVVLKATAEVSSTGSEYQFAFSADVGPDLLAPWRGPTHAIIYAASTLPRKPLGLVDAQGRDDCNVLLRIPTDTSVFTMVRRRRFKAVDIPLVDVPQMIWDLRDLGGDDRLEAAEELRQWFIKRRKTT